jgi:hypothetical protein
MPSNCSSDRSTPPGGVTAQDHGSGRPVDWADGVTAGSVPVPRRWLILAVVLCASVMNQLDTTVVNVAAPSVQADIGGGAATVQWLAAGYTLAFAVFLITGGRLGDIHGHRRMFLLGAIGSPWPRSPAVWLSRRGC